MPEIITERDDGFVLTDGETGVTAQGTTKVEALLALADALAGDDGAAEPPLRPPLSEAEIERIDDDRLRALAWDLDAIARAYNYGSDPTLPDPAREEPRPWIRPDEVARLEAACASIRSVHTSVLERVGDDLQGYADGD